MFPTIYCEQPMPASQVEAMTCLNLEKAGLLLGEICNDILSNPRTNHKELKACNVSCITESFLNALPGIAAALHTDIVAAFVGDPAAKSNEEVMLAYPSFEAISVYRIAHCLQTLGVPMLPRMMTESAHSKTGIDIHPGATIGNYFFIDHGTGVVIGETTVIGDHVKLYQGVTLGAKNFKYDPDGRPLDEPRHPILEDNVTVYANTTILGRVTIGHDTVVGGNVWLTHNVPPRSRILQTRAVEQPLFTDGAGI
jgi:serine O-acetyltransferase